MPEHELFDLDAAFAKLERDIATISSPRGAGQAVASARRRRRTTYGAIAAVAVLAVGGVAISQGLGGHNRATGPSDRPLPAPAPLSAQGFNDATQGWTGTWRPAGSGDSTFIRQQVDIRCNVLVQDQTVAQPTRVGVATFLTTDHSQLVEYRAGIRGVPGATQEYDATVVAFSGCPGHADRSFSYPGGAGVTVDALPGTQGGEVVTVAARYDDRVGVLLLGRVESVPTASQAAALADLTLAATMDDGTYGETLSQSGPTRIDPTQTVGSVWAQALEPALSGWSTPWDPRLPQDASQASTDLALPDCAGQPDRNDSGPGLTANVGRDGFEWAHWFDSDAGAVKAVDDLQQAMAGCSTPYDVHTVTLPSGRPVVVASGPQVVLWFTRVASHVLVLQIPAGHAAPPDDVSVHVGAVLEHVLEQPATTTVSPDGEIPPWMQKEIAAAPTFGP